MSETKPFLCGPQEGQAIWHFGSLVVFKATGADTGGQYWLAELSCNRGYGSPVHVHSREDELFQILDGEMSIEVGDEKYHAKPGASVFLPRNVPHSYKAESDTVKALVLGTPAGYENWFVETGTPAERLEVPAFDPSTFPDFGAVIASTQKYGGQVLGPPRD
ncbi:MAG TPA: cupin domain-containing protein [Actinophytocola sp.]|jgi:quercetin dioxygenase-like cupin family protein|uniref:cupin domain-containing protein n=1 Tax=Actinophytocola sp. TaxID=1872138 RepID=UPI002F953BDC